MAKTLALPYDAASGCAARHAWFDSVRALGWAVFLDSGDPRRTRGRYDVMAAGPAARLESHRGETSIRHADGRELPQADAFTGLRSLVGMAEGMAEADWPLYGGTIGYLAYELGRASAFLPIEKAGTAPFMPEAAFGLYAWTIVIDHERQRAAITSLPTFPDAEAEAIRDRVLAAKPTAVAFQLDGPIVSTLDWEAYQPRAQRVIDYIRAGDTYQVNLTREFRAPCSGDPWRLYRHLHDTNPAPMGAFLEYPFGAVLSSSPERFVTVDGGRAHTQPIKGTRRRRPDPEEDRRVREELAASAKDRAENVMIVDLLRNDFGRVCAAGSVSVPKLCELESFATVHHLVSTVEGRLAGGRDAIDLLRACFPGGSITGAPKRRAMEIIDELEPHRREVYCGAIGYVSPAGRLDMSIPIRTTVIANGELRFFAGGGIVADSSPEAEFEETEVKIAAIRRALARFTALPVGGDKAALRKALLARREALFARGSTDFAVAITARLRELPQYRMAKAVLATLSFGTEWDTWRFARAVIADGKRLVLPRMVKNPKGLDLHVVGDLESQLVPGPWNIREPDPAVCARASLADVDFALVPALSCDRLGIRLGYGGGYFDRLLGGAAPDVFKVVALPEAMLAESLPGEAHDIPVDAYLTEESFLMIGEQP